ncbi:MAG: hypothetical protein JWR59_739 [Brevundimonas sp.]|nr:hypothetical protein [Brevundimonas sp.]
MSGKAERARRTDAAKPRLDEGEGSEGDEPDGRRTEQPGPARLLTDGVERGSETADFGGARVPAREDDEDAEREIGDAPGDVAGAGE